MSTGKLLRDQEQISKQFPMMVDDVSASSSVQTISGETVSLYYSNSGTRTIDAGQAAGTAVHGRLANKNVLDAAGSRLGTFNDTSLSFTGDCLTTQVRFPTEKLEPNQNATWANKLSAVTAGFSNGQYCVDYRTGDIYGVKATATANLTSTSYLINMAQSGASGGVSSDVNVTKIGGTAVITTGVAGTFGVGGDTSHDAVDAGNPIKIGGKASTSIPTAVSNGDRVNQYFDEYGFAGVKDKAYDSSSTSNKGSETNPLSSQHGITSQVDTTNVAAATNYYPSSTGGTMDGYGDLSLSGKFIDADGTVTLTLEVTNDEDPATADWIPVYFRDDKNDVPANSITVTNGTVTYAVSANNCNYKYFRWPIVTSGATNTVIAKERKKAL